MASAGKKAASGAVSGAAAGSAFGPWGTAIGAVVGGVGGYLQGDDPSAPNYVPPPPPTVAGGSTSQYGGTQYDPVTGRVIYTDNTANGYDQAGNYQRQLMMQAMLGGNGAQIGLDSQIAQAKAYIDQLKAQGAKGAASKLNPAAVPSEYQGLLKFLDDSGKLPDMSDTNAIFDGRVNTPQAKALRDQFQKDTGGNYGGGGAIGFAKWLRDFQKTALNPLYEGFQKTQQLQQGNAETNDQAIQAAQQRLDNLLKVQASGASTQQDFAQNPLMNFLNQRNAKPGTPDYMAQYADPNIGTMQDTFQKYLGQAGQDTDSTAFKIAGANDPGMPDAAKSNSMLMNLAGGAGGERMASLAPFESTAGAFINNLNRTAERNYNAQANLAQQQAARRGVMGGSDISRLAAEQALEDTKAANAAQGYTMDTNDRDKWFQQNFAVNAHNSDVARQGALAQMTAQGQGFQNELAAKQLYNQLQNQAWLNNQNLKQQNFGNAMTSLNQTTGLRQNQINNARYEQNLDQQNFQNRMGLLGFLQGADQQSYNQNMGNSQMALNQGSLGFQVGSHNADTYNNYQASNTAGQNAQNMAQWQQQINDSAAQQQAWGQAMQGFGAAYGANPDAWNFGGGTQQVQAGTPSSSIFGSNSNPYGIQGSPNTGTSGGLPSTGRDTSGLFQLPQTANLSPMMLYNSTTKPQSQTNLNPFIFGR